MVEEKKETNLVMAGLSFSKTKIAEACSNEKNTTLAIALIAFSVLFATVLAFFNGNGGNSGFGRDGYIGWQAAIAEFGSATIGTFLSAFIMIYVIRIYKVKLTYPETLRLYGAAIIWTILGTIFGLIPNLGVIGMAVGIALWLAYNFSLMFGIAGYTKIKLGQAFLTIVLTFIAVFIVIILYGMVIGTVFA
ncbi:MAG: hypothetical protein B6I38_03450 [Anaerolineaceae bacterium 4572_5.1]|nr:MAG: hypothetical protein B6I38_03450 [Anaerolineaceae bacterium 4572_5.1]